MKMFALVATLVTLAGAALADPLEGLWRTAPDDNGNSGLIEVAPCGAALCGTLIRALDASGAEMARDNVGPSPSGTPCRMARGSIAAGSVRPTGTPSTTRAWF